DTLAERFDQIISGSSDFDDDFIAEFDCIENAILTSHATTIDGLRVKARAACWALLGDLNPSGELTTDKRMALSIVRDLILLYDSYLENPGALKKMVVEIEDGASHLTP
ncbi:MAG TPA: hypothetical protein VIK28_09430, partial [Sedimentisphaerales bacterium]